jgi:hypothetical protein
MNQVLRRGDHVRPIDGSNSIPRGVASITDGGAECGASRLDLAHSRGVRSYIQSPSC